jgi:serine protease Do
VTRGYLGIVAEAVTDDVAAELGLQDGRGVLVTGVAGGSPAAGLAWARSGGNVVLKANGQVIDSPGQLRNLIADTAPGSTITLEVWQNGKTKMLSAKAAQRGADTRGI